MVHHGRDQESDAQSEGSGGVADAEDAHARDSRYQAGDLIDGRYQLSELLGRGGIGEVWAAEHLHLKSQVAIKLFINAPDADEAQTAEALDRFRFEAQISAMFGKCSRHVVLVQDAGSDERGPFMVMERVSGPPLDGVLAESGALDSLRLIDLLGPIAEALDQAHACGIVHRDLKPSNILLHVEAGREIAKLADFGIAKGVDMALSVAPPKQTALGLVVGTPDYMSPEQVSGEAVSASADLWALAVVVYECLTAAPPFYGASHMETMIAVATRPFAKASSLSAELPAAIDGWFDRALNKDRASRFGSASEMLTALQAIIAPQRRSLASEPGPVSWREVVAARGSLPSVPGRDSLVSRPSLASVPDRISVSARAITQPARGSVPATSALQQRRRSSRPPRLASQPDRRSVPPRVPLVPGGSSAPDPVAFTPPASRPPAGSRAPLWRRHGLAIGALVAVNLALLVAGLLAYRGAEEPRSAAAGEPTAVSAHTHATSAATALDTVAASTASPSASAQASVASASASASASAAKPRRPRARPRPGDPRDPSSVQ